MFRSFALTFAFFVGLMSSADASAIIGSNSVEGNIVEFFAGDDALYLRFEGDAIPTDCAGSSVWLRILEQEQVMVSVALSMLMSKQTHAKVFTSGITGGHCSIGQYRPTQFLN